MPERHRSLRAVFEQSWRRLSQREQAALAKLTIFEGGCTRHAAASVAEADLDLLAILVEKAFVRHTAAGRYDMHPLLRQFAMEKLRNRQEIEKLNRRYIKFYLDLLRLQGAELYGPKPQDAIVLLKEGIYRNAGAGFRKPLTFDQAFGSIHDPGHGAKSLQLGPFLNQMPDKKLAAAQQAERMTQAVGTQFAEAGARVRRRWRIT